MTDRIEKTIDLKAPVERVWRALTDHEEFGQWFRVDLEGPFAPGQLSRGRITHPGYEHVAWEARVVRMDAPRLFSLTWHPYAVELGALPAHRRDTAFRMNDGGWAAQMENIRAHVEA